jgi:alpha-glucosidase
VEKSQNVEEVATMRIARETCLRLSKRGRFLIFLSALSVAAPAVAYVSPSLKAPSPDGTLEISLVLKSNPAPYLPGVRAYYRVWYKGKQLLKDSPLGLDFLGAPALESDWLFMKAFREARDSTWTNDFGTERAVPDHYNQLTVSLREKGTSGRRLDLIFRAYNGAVAFRYLLPEQDSLKQFTISSEDTGFYFAGPAKVFALDLGSMATSYESEFRPESLDDIKPTSTIGEPLLVHTSAGPWLAITEADLNDYAGMYFRGVRGVPQSLMSKLSPLPEHSDHVVVGATPKASPWRVLLVGDEPTALIESSPVILDLNPPSKLADTSWIKPGKSAWDWWSGSYASGVDFQPGMNTTTMEHYIDFAAQAHLDYMLIDAGWSPEEDILHPVAAIDMPAILAHAREKGVRILLWLRWNAVNKQMDEAFPLYEQWGVAGVKVDFMNRNDQEMVNFYQRVVEKAAARHLVVDFHGAYPPTGLERTYPNLLTREGVMGMEYSKWSTRVTPEHDTTLPFTRFLAGPADYTPGCFHNATRAQFKPQHLQPMCQGTRAHQLAMYVDFFSPLAMLSDYPEDYVGQPGLEFLEKVPTVWDETRALAGEPGQFVAIARRKGDTWYLGAMANWEARDLDLPLGFLGAGSYDAQIFADGPQAETDATSLDIRTEHVNREGKLHVHLASGGGVAAILTPASH